MAQGSQERVRAADGDKLLRGSSSEFRARPAPSTACGCSNCCARLDVETHLVMSKSAEMTLVYETDLKPKDVRALASVHYPVADIGAAISSGSFPTMGMVIAPCSIRTMSEIATGVTDIAADARRRRGAQGEAPPGACRARDAAARRASAHHDDARRHRRRHRADRAGVLQPAEIGRRHHQSHLRPPARPVRHRHRHRQALEGRPGGADCLSAPGPPGARQRSLERRRRQQHPRGQRCTAGTSDDERR